MSSSCTSTGHNATQEMATCDAVAVLVSWRFGRIGRKCCLLQSCTLSWYHCPPRNKHEAQTGVSEYACHSGPTTVRRCGAEVTEAAAAGPLQGHHHQVMGRRPQYSAGQHGGPPLHAQRCHTQATLRHLELPLCTTIRRQTRQGRPNAHHSTAQVTNATKRPPPLTRDAHTPAHHQEVHAVPRGGGEHK